ncbi:HET domain-containing protein [Microdochium nivale]|nr:HET domain-containing protein [Microdochium nivale]
MFSHQAEAASSHALEPGPPRLQEPPQLPVGIQPTITSSQQGPLPATTQLSLSFATCLPATSCRQAGLTGPSAFGKQPSAEAYLARPVTAVQHGRAGCCCACNVIESSSSARPSTAIPPRPNAPGASQTMARGVSDPSRDTQLLLAKEGCEYTAEKHMVTKTSTNNSHNINSPTAESSAVAGHHPMAVNTAPRPRLQYRKLDWSKGEMRFLELRPAAHGSIEDSVVCRMVHLPLDEGVDFIAISSLLGETPDTEKIQVNGYAVSIPIHIAQALRHARAVFAPHAQRSHSSSSSGSGSSRPRWLQHLLKHFGSHGGHGHQQEQVLRIWTDSLCLNAEDRRERAQQRSIMGRVYWKAQTVVGWVGLKIEQTDAGIRLIRDFDDAMPATFHEPGDRVLHPEYYSPYHEWARSVVHHFDPVAPGGLGTADFLARSFFKRRWIIEEMALAKVATFLIGDAIVSWNQLLRLNLAMEEFKDYPSNVCPPETRPAIHDFPLETIHALLDEFERRKAMEKLEGLNRSMAPSYDSKDTGSF